MTQRKMFRLDLTIAVEAEDEEEAFKRLSSDETIEHIQNIILNSKDKIAKQFIDEEDPIIN